MPQWHSLPDLPPRLKSAVIAAAENLTAVAHSEGIELGDQKGKTTPFTDAVTVIERMKY